MEEDGESSGEKGNNRVGWSLGDRLTLGGGGFYAVDYSGAEVG